MFSGLAQPCQNERQLNNAEDTVHGIVTGVRAMCPDGSGERRDFG